MLLRPPPQCPEPSLRAPLAVLGWGGRRSSPDWGSLKQSSWAQRRGQVADATIFVSAKHNRCILWCRTIENLNIFLAEQQKQNVLFLFCFGFASSRRTGSLAHILDLCPSFLPGQYMMSKSHIASGWWQSRGKEVRCDVGCACVCARALECFRKKGASRWWGLGRGKPWQLWMNEPMNKWTNKMPSPAVFSVSFLIPDGDKSFP